MSTKCTECGGAASWSVAVFHSSQIATPTVNGTKYACEWHLSAVAQSQSAQTGRLDVLALRP